MTVSEIISRYSTLPASAIARTLNSVLSRSASVVVSAPPGAGKSTLLPLTILETVEEKNKIIVLEPRRMAARQIASRMAEMLGEKVGQTVGYRVRFESKVSDMTRIEVVTEGILTRMLVSDPTLDGVSVVIFDEFHERSLTSDVDLALCRQVLNLVRDDLRLVVMSATIDTSAISEALGCEVVQSQGRMFPVEVIRSKTSTQAESVAEDVAHMVRLASRQHTGDILAFLPGEADIRRCASLLEGALSDTMIYPLYGQLPLKEQRQAIAPSPEGSRKVVLSTSIAETSLTIEGVRVVIDSGFCRKMVFNPQNGLSHLETTRISLDMADQRTGRAGRLEEGVCYRLWDLSTEARMEKFRTPEILEADLSPMVLDIAAWGEKDPLSLPWMSIPPRPALLGARTLLESLGALDEKGITSRGTMMASIGAHPRIAGMLLTARQTGQAALAADIAAILEEKDPLGESYGADLRTRVYELRQARSKNLASRQWDRIIRISEQYLHLQKASRQDNGEFDPEECGVLLASAYPERVAKSRDSLGHYTLACGDNVLLPMEDELTSYQWLSVASLCAGARSEGRIFMGCPVDPQRLPWAIRERQMVSWDSKAGCLVCREERRIGVLSVSSKPLQKPDQDTITAVIAEAARKDGASMFTFDERTGNLQRRIGAVRQWRPEEDIPDVSSEALLLGAAQWLPLYIGKATTSQELRKIDMTRVIWGMLTYAQQSLVDSLAPEHIEVPTGSRIRVEYRQGADAPVLRVRLQECFGMKATPRVNGGRCPVLMELLSPGFKPVQLTQDLENFWKETYFEVRKDLRRRYPKHFWPDNPENAAPVRGVKKP